MSDLSNKAENRSAQPTLALSYDGIADRDQFLRKQMERGSEMLLRAMICELRAIGRIA